jgi:hypothetical protein
MRIHEIIQESIHHLPDDVKSSIKGAITVPDINQNSGDSYKAYRFGLALAGAPEYPTKATNDIGGDALLSSYTDQELEMVNYALKQSKSGKLKRLTSNRSEEIPTVNKTSVVAKIKKNKYGV